jgi:hypothetical protein
MSNNTETNGTTDTAAAPTGQLPNRLPTDTGNGKPAAGNGKPARKAKDKAADTAPTVDGRMLALMRAAPKRSVTFRKVGEEFTFRGTVKAIPTTLAPDSLADAAYTHGLSVKGSALGDDPLERRPAATFDGGAKAKEAAEFMLGIAE